MSILIKGMEMPTTGLYFASVDNTGGKDKTVITVERMLGNRDVRQIVGSFELVPVPPHVEQPMVRGKWEKRMEEKETPYYKSFTPIWSCSECGTEYDPSLCMIINFCPNCGADMREES